MKRILLFALCATCCMGTHAQVIDDDFDTFMKSKMASFDKFIDDADKKFISFLRNPWKEFEAKKPEKNRIEPEPVKPVVYDEKKDPVTPPVELNIEEILGQSTSESKQRPQGKISNGEKVEFEKQQKKPAVPVVSPITPTTKPDVPTIKPATPITKPDIPTTKPDAPTPTPAALPTKPDTMPEKPTAPEGSLYKEAPGKQMVDYFRQKIYIDKSLKGVCSIGNLRENAIANAYEAMCAADHKELLADCRQVKKDLNLNDWGLFLLVRDVSKSLCADDNAAVVMQQFMLNELGYKSKMARSGDRDRLLLFVATDCKIYGKPYFTAQDGTDYYCTTNDNVRRFYMCQENSPKAKSKLDMHINQALSLNADKVNSVHANRAGTVTVSVDVPKSLMEFYNSVPQCDYSTYVNAEVNPSVANSVLSTLAPLVDGKNEQDAANLLINFVQTGFKYATDEEQFGYEKPFFVEELFYYPYCDCEDRAVLYSYLVRNLLKLDVVLLDYPNHIATAVCFNDNIAGDFVTVGGKKYTVCDPTYIGASIGKTMPQFKNVAAKVLKY